MTFAIGCAVGGAITFVLTALAASCVIRGVIAEQQAMRADRDRYRSLYEQGLCACGEELACLECDFVVDAETWRAHAN